MKGEERRDGMPWHGRPLGSSAVSASRSDVLTTLIHAANITAQYNYGWKNLDFGGRFYVFKGFFRFLDFSVQKPDTKLRPRKNIL